MIIVRLKGGLGNQLFQYAAGLTIAKKYNETLKLDATGYDNPKHVSSDTPRKYRLFPFNLSSSLAAPDEAKCARNPFGIISKLLRAFNEKVLKKSYIDYHPSFFSKRHSYVEGYFQCEKNFVEVSDQIRQEFTLKKEFESSEYLKERDKINKEKSVAVHIRRGDYAYDTTTSNYFGSCSKDYYLEAMKYMKSKIQNPVFYFFSDDIEWTKKEFGEQEDFLFMSNPKLQDYEELILISDCAHTIIANSSFSWWGAWLNKNPEKVIIAPKRWLKVIPNPQPNIIPASWIQMQN